MRYRALAIALTTALLLTAGCATTKGPTPEDQVAEAVQAWKSTFQNVDQKAADAIFSDNFKSNYWRNKYSIHTFLGSSEATENLPNADFITEEATTTIEGDTATVGPLYIKGHEDLFEVHLTFTKETDAWRITNLDIAQ
jgi:hypothetical protein